jgi:hypothetical protein
LAGGAFIVIITSTMPMAKDVSRTGMLPVVIAGLTLLHSQ